MAAAATEQVKSLIVITISTNYDDILSVVIHQNQKFFERWYIVTHADDLNTINLVKTSKYSNIELLYFDFYKNSAFNKGGAIQYAQKHINSKHTNKNILILDSDIFLPDNFYDVLSRIQTYPETIYGVTKRYDYESYLDFIEDINPHEYPATRDLVGFFQFYKQTPTKFYPNSWNCSGCDMAFLRYFRDRVHLRLAVKHLGHAKTHWDGRKDRSDFCMDL